MWKPRSGEKTHLSSKKRGRRRQGGIRKRKKKVIPVSLVMRKKR